SDGRGPDRMQRRFSVPTSRGQSLSGCTRLCGIAALALLNMAPPLWAQGVLEKFSSENLGLRAIGVDVGLLGGTNIRGTTLEAVRLDFGSIAPSVRVVLGASY